MKQATRRIRDGIVGSTLSVFVRTLAPRDANSKSGCCIAKPTIIGAMTKAAALNPTVRLNADLSRLRISLRNRFIQDKTRQDVPARTSICVVVFVVVVVLPH